MFLSYHSKLVQASIKFLMPMPKAYACISTKCGFWMAQPILNEWGQGAAWLCIRVLSLFTYIYKNKNKTPSHLDESLLTYEAAVFQRNSRNDFALHMCNSSLYMQSHPLPLNIAKYCKQGVLAFISLVFQPNFVSQLLATLWSLSLSS